MNRKIWKALGIVVCMLALAAPLDDTEEKAANDYVYHRFVKEN